jgi:hypothetical protein
MVELNIRVTGSILSEAMSNASGEAQRQADAYTASQVKRFYFNVYRSEDHAFAIGSKAHDSTSRARSKATSGFIGTFELKLDADGLPVTNNVQRADVRYFIVTTEGGKPRFSKGYATRAKAEANLSYSQNKRRVVAVAVTPSREILI